MPENGVCDLTTFQCPTTAPVLCETGVCKSSPSLCPNGLENYGDGTGGNVDNWAVDGSGSAIEQDNNACGFVCLDGKEFCSPSDCLDWAAQINCPNGCSDSAVGRQDGLGLWCGAEEVLCADASCRGFEDCKPIPACPIGSTRCWDGTCTSTSCPTGAPSCDTGLARCEDGVCRSSCLRFNGCGLDAPFHCANRNCAKDAISCDSTDIGTASAGWVQRTPLAASQDHSYSSFNCEENCMADIKAAWTTYSINRNVNYQFPIALDSNLYTVGLLTVPSGSVLSESSDESLLRVRGVPDSRVRLAENKVQVSRVDEQGSYKTYPETVLSPAFECLSPSNSSDPFPVSLMYTATIDSFPVLNGDGNAEAPYYAGYNYNDVCFAKLYELTVEIAPGEYFVYKSWRCLVADNERAAKPVRAIDSTDPPGTVSFAFNTCRSGPEPSFAEGAVYAFIFAPLRTEDDSSTLIGWLAENASWVMVIGISVTILLFGSAYCCSRLYRYRKKYLEARKAVNEIRDNVVMMEQYGGKAGLKDTEVVMMSNPMILHLSDMDSEADIESLKKKEAQLKLRKLEQEQRTMQILELKQERDKVAKDLEQLSAQLLQALDKPAAIQGIKKNFMDEPIFDRHSDDSDDGGQGNAGGFRGGAFDDSD